MNSYSAIFAAFAWTICISILSCKSLIFTSNTGCQPAELSCVAMANDVETEKCYNTTTDICIAGGFNALCVNHTDVQNCRKSEFLKHSFFTGVPE